MTLEQKVAKKAKGLEKLKYKKGIAIVLLTIDETASEYESDAEYRVRIYFKTKAAIKRIGDLLGEIRFNKKETISRFERGINFKEMTVKGYEKSMLDGGSNIIKDVRYVYANHYTGSRYSLSLDPRKSFPDSQKNYYTGSTADGQPLSVYYSYLQSSIIKGSTQYII
ncbi:hypothetical protein MZM54_05290 [[Brevibacterium] frigoritolerans]|nr:hypothetical protein [Peribacillus frigoritolerans]